MDKRRLINILILKREHADVDHMICSFLIFKCLFFQEFKYFRIISHHKVAQKVRAALINQISSIKIYGVTGDDDISANESQVFDHICMNYKF
jgi:hypothetical protein